MTGPPQRVMRFYKNLQYALECIAFKQITLIHVDKFNDPFDPNISFETDFDFDYQTIINHINQHYPRQLHDFKQRMPKENWSNFTNVIKDYCKDLLDSAFIFSTCGISEDTHAKDNLYMWSHYGNGHRGVAIEFDTIRLADAVMGEQKRLGGPKIEPWFVINYKDDVPKITCEHIFQYVMIYTNNADKETLEQTELAKTLPIIFSLKSLEWKVENEWRIMRQNKDTKLKICRLDILDDSITAVYLGCRYELNADHMEDPFIYETKRHFPRAEIFKARKRKGKFALDFERIFVPPNV